MSVRKSVRVAAVGLALVTGVSAWALQPGSGQPPAGERPPSSPGRGPGGGGGGQPGERGPGGGRQAPTVEAGMRQMNGALRRLSGQIGEASKNEENLRLLGEMQRGCVTAKSAPLPEHVLEGKDDAAKTKVKMEFRVDLIAIMRHLLDAEQAILDGKNDLAKSKLDEAQKLKEAGHTRLGV
ncbi:MAG: hypothetical protein AB7K52_08135 [Phycisphaerales bacterium]